MGLRQMTAADAEQGRRRLSRSAAGGHNPWLIAGVVSIATFMEVLDVTIVNVSLQHMAGSLAVSYDESTWISTSYLVSNVDHPANERLAGDRHRAKALLHARGRRSSP